MLTGFYKSSLRIASHVWECVQSDTTFSDGKGTGYHLAVPGK